MNLSFVEIVYNKILSMKKRKFSLSDIAKVMGLEYGFDKKTLAQTLDNMAKKGKLGKLKNGDYVLNFEPEVFKCTLLGTSKDYAFARPITTTKDKDNDIFISVANMNDACHGDVVMVEVGVTGKDRKYKSISIFPHCF